MPTCKLKWNFCNFHQVSDATHFTTCSTITERNDHHKTWRCRWWSADQLVWSVIRSVKFASTIIKRYFSLHVTFVCACLGCSTTLEFCPLCWVEVEATVNEVFVWSLGKKQFSPDRKSIEQFIQELFICWCFFKLFFCHCIFFSCDILWFYECAFYCHFFLTKTVKTINTCVWALTLKTSWKKQLEVK